ncbi:MULTISPECIES: Rrf2 family transcriptional regulator [unclassified Breznakia]|uniref:RrF2 family transcriptional regulator n=1 Tax=unclassified Breznakia TaxID=2623764 RepID=UPI0024755BEB|nr:MULTISPECIES: Rrf2 family transcriptional regulator [unclassified Breznakia]MDH6366399.1 Rrf2 family protein [Breznakia sp. PH1-1]MDH6403492.1 Rrf2 family protein [Breznakia sp. PF1-11]MDH6411201.1 Rrf2 family protein [Breznakia sp. PFB1-11]MDH6413536.1 Rrf2 family protein [Breznakia sp. PFB1-14]MDH6415746.1 Rrf2 family protein [Breznakia sp. PFB1-4]
MKLTTKSRYAVRVLVGCAIFEDQGLITVKNASRHLQLSPKYIETIFIELKKANYITSVRGHRGGYKLALRPEDITIYSVIMAMEPIDGLAPRRDNPDTLSRFVYREVWYRVGAELKMFLNDISIADLIEERGGIEEIKKTGWYKDYNKEELDEKRNLGL